jgi:hypothetical protein
VAEMPTPRFVRLTSAKRSDAADVWVQPMFVGAVESPFPGTELPAGAVVVTVTGMALYVRESVADVMALLCAPAGDDARGAG